MEGDAAVHEARVIVGKPETPTPIFSNVMRYVLINPSWQVPNSIIRKEFASKLGALSRRGYEVKTVGGRLTVRQLPGDDNALGRIAFMFPNDHAVYLHDTPARELFDEDARAFSHGCIRVEDPMSLAEVVLDGATSGWTEERIEAKVGGAERTVFLPRPLPIHIEYFTEFADEFGGLRERARHLRNHSQGGRHTRPGKSRLKGPRDGAIGDSNRFLPNCDVFVTMRGPNQARSGTRARQVA